MMKNTFAGLICATVIGMAVWFGNAAIGHKSEHGAWVEVVPGVLRTDSSPRSYALVEGSHAILIGASQDAADLRAKRILKIDGVLLNHHQRDLCSAADGFLQEGTSVRAPKLSAEWLQPKNVRRYWQESLPLRNSRAAYFVSAIGLEGIRCDLEDEQNLDWQGWTIRVMAAPGPSPDHIAFLARKGTKGPLLAFCGDALATSGKLWAPFTTDWDHWTDAGLAPAAKSLRQLAGCKPTMLLPSHGEPIVEHVQDTLEKTAAAVAEAALLKSFEGYTKKRLGNPPNYSFLAKEQKESRGEKPWSQISEHLFLTGNTYVLVSKSKDFLVVDPWGKLSAEQIELLKRQQGLGKLEVVMFSHAHWDHYDGIFHLPDRDQFQVWALDRVAGPIADPYRWHAPFLDSRPVKFDRQIQEGDTATWREYRFRFHHFPGQTEFTMGVETTIDGKKCYFTADNFFHQDQFSGSGGWMGLNRSWPLSYKASAQKVLDAKPDWVLAEHGGPFEFNAEDFRRRVTWGKASAAAADALCFSDNHRQGWDPNRVHVEPVVQKVSAGSQSILTLVAQNHTNRLESLNVQVEGRGIIANQEVSLEIPAKSESRKELRVKVPENLGTGRHVFALRVLQDKFQAEADAFFALDVGP